MRYLALGTMLLLMLAGGAYGTGTESFKENNDEGGVAMDSDGCYLDVGTALSDTTHDTWCLITNNDAGGDTKVSLIAWKGMFSYIPDVTSRDDIVSATLKLYQRGPVGGEVIAVNRVTSDWLLSDAGTNETIVTGRHINPGSDIHWAGGHSAGFSSLDYTTEDQATFTIVEYNVDRVNLVDVTEMVKDMFEYGNYGFVLRLVSPQGADPWFQNDERANLGDDGYLANPTLYIEYETEATYTLTVNSGTGDGTYTHGQVVAISADAAPSGMAFKEWVGDTGGVADLYATSTNYTMPAANSTITATYAYLRTLTVNSGTGGGQFIVDDVVSIVADTPTSGGVPGLGVIFDQWIGDTAYVASTTSESTTVTMPDADVVVTASYIAATLRTLTVNSGSGSGSYWPFEVVDISADAPPSGTIWDEWTGDVQYLDDLYAQSTTVTMPDQDVIVTATYEAAPVGTFICFREGGGAGYFVDATFDDTFIHAPADVNDQTYGTGYNGVHLRRDENETGRTALIAVKDMFTELPPSTGSNVIQINAATLYLYIEHVDYDGGGNTGVVGIHRITNDDWLPDAAGSNETDVSGMHADKSALIEWADGSFSTADYDDAGGVTGLVPSVAMANDGDEYAYDITPVMQDVYTAVRNNGLALVLRSPGWMWALYYASETPSLSLHPAIRIDYSYAPATWYTLTVTSGSGSGSYTEGTEVNIVADAPPSGYLFNTWIGGTDYIADVNDPDTILTMPALPVTATATYGGERTLTVNSGSGSGTYGTGAVVPIQADPPETGYEFSEWIGDTTYVASTTSASTTVTMPDANVEVTATYVLLPTYLLTVNSGTGDGNHWEGKVVDIQADPAPTDYVFEEWIGDTDYVLDNWSGVTTVTMPAQAVTITATYRYAPYHLTVESGGGDGWYDTSDVVRILADAPPTNEVFDKWIGDTAGIADVSSMYTTLTMPSADAAITATFTADVIDGFRIKFREGGGTGYVDTTFDDTWLELDVDGDPDDVTHGTEGELSVVDGPTTGGGSPKRAALICAKDLLTELTPSTGGTPITINSAYLIVYRYMGPKDTPFSIARVTTNWVPDPAGTNEDDVSGLWSENSSWTYWTSTADGFTTADYDAANSLQAYMQLGGWNDEQKYDVTSLISDIYTTANNYGLALIPEVDFVSPDYIYDQYYGINFRSSEYATVSGRPTLQIDYQYGPDYTLTVNSGSGSGEYPQGAVVEIVADPAASGMQFSAWIGDTGAVTDTGASTTDVTMPAANVTVTATYGPLTYTLTVNSGSGGGEYAEGATPTITADTPTTGYGFDEWIGDTDYVADPGSASTIVTMPPAPVEVTATYGAYWPGDRNEDKFVGQTDLDIVLDMWGKSGGEITDKRADVNDDDFVGQTDLDYVLDDWGKSGYQP